MMGFLRPSRVVAAVVALLLLHVVAASLLAQEGETRRGGAPESPGEAAAGEEPSDATGSRNATGAEDSAGSSEAAADEAPSTRAAPGEDPAWVVYEEGVAHLRSRELGAAMESFRRAIRLRGSPFPEAEAGIGMVFSSEGQSQLAERQFRRALDQAQAFDIPHEAYRVRYLLAQLYFDQIRNRRAYQETLSSVVEDDASFSAPENESLKEAYRETLIEEGIDRLLVLYRVEENFAREAHRLLGEHYLDSRNADPALEHLLHAVLMIFSTAIDEYRRENPAYEFSTLQDFLERIARHEAILDYLDRSRAYRVLYNLGTAFLGVAPRAETPRDIWRLLVAENLPGGAARERVGRPAQAQLRDPRLDRAIVH
jgi:cytochrome c-type biogenesis protein CcmH/NrfG